MSAGTSPRHPEDAKTLVALADEDQRVRAELVAAGTLWDGYHPVMEAVHRRNAERLREIIDRIGWPVATLVGDGAAEAAWLVAQHAIGEPDFQRRCLRAIEVAVAAGDAPPWQAAMLDDRIRVFEGRPQRYGTQLEADEDGVMHACTLEDPERVEELRASVGLEPLADRLAREPRSPPPADRAAFDREAEAWLRRVGWRS